MEKNYYGGVISLFLFLFFLHFASPLHAQEGNISHEPIIKKDVDMNNIEPRAKTQQLRDEQSGERNLDNLRFQSGVSIEENPETIRVALTEYMNCFPWVDAGQPVVRVETMSFKDYVRNVLPNEWISSWHEESLKSGAIAAKNYGWRKIQVGGRHYLKDMHDHLDEYPDVVDNTCDQVYLPNTSNARADAAVDAIWNYRLIRDGRLLNNFYLATGDQCNNSPYQPCLPQWETQYRAEEGKNWQEIIHQYYDPVEILTLSTASTIEQGFPAAVDNGVYRFWSDQKQGHFYTASLEERNQVISTYDDSVWRYEGVAYKASATKQTNMTPVYRFWSDQKQGHFYTASKEEKEYVIITYDDSVWRYEGIAFYVYPLSYTKGNINTVHRFWSDQNQKHFYTASEAERDYVIETYDDAVWRYEGTAWKVFP